MSLSTPALQLNRVQFGQGPNLTFIHGWSAQNSVWQEWIEQAFAQDFSITLIELPGCGDSPNLSDDFEPEALQELWLQAFEQALPNEPTHLVGWSLGGLLAQQLAARQPNKIISLTCLASTPKFMQAKDWHWAVQPGLLNDFIKAIREDTLATLTHFWKLQNQGADGARALMKLFLSQMKQRKVPKLASLAQGLQLLKTMDNRQTVADLPQPTLWLLGENDPLIPQQMISELSQTQTQAHVKIINGAAHMPFFSHPKETAEHLRTFIQQQ